MFDNYIQPFIKVDDFLWTYCCVPAITLLGLYLTIKLRGAQFHRAIRIKTLLDDYKKQQPNADRRGIDPLHAFYITIGGCIGVGNIVAVCTAVKIGGPGALFWMWVAAILGMIVKYAEVYLGITFRVPNQMNSYDGGPMYYFKKIFKSNIPSMLFALLLAIYGTEVYMFKVVSDSISINWHIPHYIVVISLLTLVLVTVMGGAKRVGQACSLVMPAFLAVYCIMGIWVLIQNASSIPSVLSMIVKSAFTGHSAIGGFAGSSAIYAISQGVKKACYTGDIGVGYAGVVCAETSDESPNHQADLSLLGVFVDTFIVCTMTIMITLSTGVWTQNIPSSEWVATSLGMYFPGMQIFMPILLFLLGYSTLIAFFHVGLKCARFIAPKIGTYIYYVYSTSVFLIFSYVDQSHALLLMSLCGACMLLLNLYAIIRLRHVVKT